MTQALIGVGFDSEGHKYELLNNYKGRDGKFIKGFLLNDTRNKNGWRVTWESILQYASDFINHPGIYYTPSGEPDHTGGGSYKENMSNQETYRVVNIIDVMIDEPNHILNYVGEILDEDFEAIWESGKINMTSPAVWPEDMKVVGTTENGRDMLDVYKWRALHVAYIDEPAYGEDAFTIASCDGDGATCKVRLSAKTEGKGLCANDNLGPLMEVPIIKKKLQSLYTPCELKDFHASLAASRDPTDCVANKLKIVIEDNPEMDKDQQLAIAYAFCQNEGMAELVDDLDKENLTGPE